MQGYDKIKKTSLIPGLDTFTNLASIPVDLMRGDYISAGLDLLGVIPFVGEIADVAKTARTADRIIDGVRTADKVVDGVRFADRVQDAAKSADSIVDGMKAVDALKIPDTAVDGIKSVGNIGNKLSAKDIHELYKLFGG